MLASFEISLGNNEIGLKYYRHALNLALAIHGDSSTHFELPVLCVCIMLLEYTSSNYYPIVPYW
jgi:hypothetical protein